MPKPYKPRCVTWPANIANFHQNTTAPGTWGGPKVVQPKPNHSKRGQLRGGR